MSDINEINEITTPIDDRFYRLADRIPVHCTLAEFATWMLDEKNRIVAQSTVNDISVSTVFTGIDQNWGGNGGAPILFETMLFGLPDDLQPRWSHSTWDEAMEIHNLLIATLTDYGLEPVLEEVRKKAAS